MWACWFCHICYHITFGIWVVVDIEYDYLKLFLSNANSQVVVEKKIAKERKLTRHDVGREAFVSEVSLVLNSFPFYWF